MGRMKPGRPVIALVLLFAACTGTRSAAPPAAEGFALPVLAAALRRPKHVVVVSIARLTPDRYLASAGKPPDMQTLANLAAAGVAAESVTTVAPASMYPAHASLVTGREPAVHGISADLQLGKRGMRGARYWHASKLAAPSLFNLADHEKLRVAALAWPSTVGAPIPYLVTDVVPTRPGENWLEVIADSSTPELLTLLEKLGGAEAAANAEGPERDAALTRMACELFALRSPPHLTMLRLSQTVSPVALHGKDSARARNAFANADAELHSLLECMTRLGVIEESAVLVVGDHGVIPVHTVVAPNAVLEREGLIEIDLKGGVVAWSAIARSNGGTTFVYASDERRALRARRLLAEQGERTRAFRVVSAAEMLASGADREAWFGLEAEPGFYFSDATRPPLLGVAALRAVGGYLPERREMDTGFVAWGRGIRTAVRIPLMRLTDVAPTVARLLGFEFEDGESRDFDGRPLVGVLRVPATRR